VQEIALTFVFATAPSTTATLAIPPPWLPLRPAFERGKRVDQRAELGVRERSRELDAAASVPNDEGPPEGGPSLSLKRVCP
jgi:hypothetical protein